MAKSTLPIPHALLFVAALLLGGLPAAPAPAGGPPPAKYTGSIRNNSGAAFSIASALLNTRCNGEGKMAVIFGRAGGYPLGSHSASSFAYEVPEGCEFVCVRVVGHPRVGNSDANTFTLWHKVVGDFEVAIEQKDVEHWERVGSFSADR
ncbi:MAG: hypothetical protein H0S85_10925 [Desulfovibrionaceae bacterium]|jgi:hypothetical protein|nr:hypothetical protein [Desulfovibrionaceae bacterium]